jgi:phosphoesterase RecJ-like protein
MKGIFGKKDIKLLGEKIRNSHNILIVTHTNPDGDAVGSVTAMSAFLENSGYPNSVWTPDKYPDYLAFLDKKQQISYFDEYTGDFSLVTNSCDLIICLDFNQLSRTGGIEKYISASDSFKILIDHHPEPESGKFDLVFSEPLMSSTCEALYNIIEQLFMEEGFPEESFGRSVAESLYVGIMTDTNNYANSVTSETFQTAANLIEKGVEKEVLQHKVFGVFSEERMRLMGHVLLNKMVILHNLEASYIVLTKEEQNKFLFREGDSEGFVNLPLNINDVNISALFTESDNYIRVSLRSVNDFSVNRLSRRYFNGGGHERAAGGRLYMPVEKVGKFFEEKLKEFIESNEKNSDQND